MAPVVVAPRGTSAALASSNAHVIAMPASATTARGVLVVFSFDSALTASVSGTGWTEIAEQAAATMGSVLAYKRPGVTLSTLTIGLSAAEEGTYVVLAFDDAHATENVTATAASGAASNADCPAHTPPGGSRDYLWVVAHCVEATDTATAAPAGYSNLTTAVGGASGASTATAERTVTAASEDPGPWTAPFDDYVTWTIAVPPAVVVPPTGSVAQTRAMLGLL